MMQENNSTHWIMGGALLLIGLFVIIALVMTRSQASGTQVDVVNSAPVVSLVKLCYNDNGSPTAANCSARTQVTPIGGGVRNTDVYAQIVDANGLGDINQGSIMASAFRTSIGASACDAGGEVDGNQCAIVSGSCIQDSAIDATTEVIKCGNLAIQSWADPTSPTADDYFADDWTVRIDVKDTANSSGNASANFEMNEIAAISFPGSIDYGSGGSARALGYKSNAAGTVDFTYMNNGNVDADGQIKADQASMGCTFGSIPAANQYFGAGADLAGGHFADELAKSLTTSFQDMDLEDVASAGAFQHRTNEGSAPQEAGHHGIVIPTVGVSGSCSGTDTIVAIKQSL